MGKDSKSTGKKCNTSTSSSGKRRGDVRTRDKDHPEAAVKLSSRLVGNNLLNEFTTTEEAKVDKLASITPDPKPESKSHSSYNTQLDEDVEEDDGEIFAKNLNGIILQYLESCGLVESYTTFYDECKASGMLIANNFQAELDKGISLQDVETLLMHFDQENGDALLELWEVLISMVNIGQNSQEVEKITFYIQVYIALIPFRQSMSEDRKQASMRKLRDYFQSKSEACTMDKEMLSLFALPFVPDPEAHPVFGSLFKIAWIKKLRSRIKNLARALCSPNKLLTRDDTDLAKMFRTLSSAVPHEIESLDGEKVSILSNAKPVEFTSGVETETSTGDASSEFSPSQLFQRMNDLIVENERFKAEESKYEKQCSQLLNVSILLAQSLEEAAQGKEVNMEQLRHEISHCLPISMLKQTNPSEKPREQSPARIDTSYESDASNNLLD